MKSNESRFLTSETSTMIVYSGENSMVKNVIYQFENGALTSSALVFVLSTDMVSPIMSFLDERYVAVGTSSPYYFFSNLNDLAIALSVQTYGVVIMYIKDTSLKSNSSKINTFNSISTVVGNELR